MALVAHLGGDLFFAREFREQACLVHLMGQRLLTVDVFAHPQSQGGGHGMGVVGRGDGDGVDVFAFLLHHHAEVRIAVGVVKALESGSGAGVVHIAQGDDVFARAAVDVYRTLAAAANGGDVEAVVGAKHSGWNKGRKRNRAGLQETAPGKSISFHE